MKKTLLLLLAVCMMVTMIPAASFAEGLDQGDEVPAVQQEVPEAEPEAEAEEEYLGYESKLRLNEGEDGWTQDPETKKWKYYYNGAPVTGKQLIGSYYYFNKSGELTVGWATISKGKYYFNPKAPDPANPSPVEPGSTYGVMQTGWKKISGYKYYLNPVSGATFGKMLTGWVDEKNYYTDPKTGKMKTGWLKLNDYKYYLDPKTGKKKTGWQNIKDYKYYFNPSNGRMKTGWLTLNDKKYYLNTKNGSMFTGFHKIGKYKYYFDKSKGVMKKGGLLTVSGNKYYFNDSGQMQTSKAIKVGKKTYYFFSSGKAVKTKGWFKGSDKKQRYGLGGGVIATGEKKIGSYWYTFNKNGLVTKKMDQIDKNMQKIVSKTNYMIMVSKKRYEVRVYTGKTNNWTRKYSWKCSIGDKLNPTPEGTFTIQEKLKKHEVKDPLTKVKVRCWGLCRFTTVKDTETGKDKDIALNSIIYRASDGSVYDGRLGVNNSRGSIRLSYNNAMWLFYNVPLKTTVYVY